MALSLHSTRSHTLDDSLTALTQGGHIVPHFTFHFRPVLLCNVVGICDGHGKGQRRTASGMGGSTKLRRSVRRVACSFGFVPPDQVPPSIPFHPRSMPTLCILLVRLRIRLGTGYTASFGLLLGNDNPFLSRNIYDDMHLRCRVMFLHICIPRNTKTPISKALGTLLQISFFRERGTGHCMASRNGGAGK
jgi:hypothetical protein